MLYVKVKGKELVDKSDIYGFTYDSNLDKKILTSAIKAELKIKHQDKTLKLQVFDQVI